jgi:hypothetical protein
MHMLIFSNAREGADDAFNEWYDTTHLPEVLQLPGVKSGVRYRARAVGGVEPEHRYLTVYEYDGEGIDFVREVGARAADGRLTMSDAVDAAGTKITAWEPI